MDLRPLSFKLTPEQITWLDDRRGGALITRSEVLRHLIEEARSRDKRRTARRHQRQQQVSA